MYSRFVLIALFALSLVPAAMPPAEYGAGVPDDGPAIGQLRSPQHVPLGAEEARWEPGSRASSPDPWPRLLALAFNPDDRGDRPAAAPVRGDAADCCPRTSERLPYQATAPPPASPA